MEAVLRCKQLLFPKVYCPFAMAHLLVAHPYQQFSFPGTVTSIGIAAFAECQMLGEAVFIDGGSSSSSISSGSSRQAYFDDFQSLLNKNISGAEFVERQMMREADSNEGGGTSLSIGVVKLFSTARL